MIRASKSKRRAKTSDVRDQVMARADGCCENCEMEYTDLEMDHFFGGSLRRVMERLETCWALCRRCHHLKTINAPGRAAWLKRFIEHAKLHGYSDEASLAEGKLESACLRG
jgi:5-methylcytosine-specific restriction endonuclease McrA